MSLSLICISIIACMICWPGVCVFFFILLSDRIVWVVLLSVNLAVRQLLWSGPKQESKDTNFSILTPEIEASNYFPHSLFFRLFLFRVYLTRRDGVFGHISLIYHVFCR